MASSSSSSSSNGQSEAQNYCVQYVVVQLPNDAAEALQKQRCATIENIESDDPKLIIGDEEVEGRFENITGTSMVFKENFVARAPDRPRAFGALDDAVAQSSSPQDSRSQTQFSCTPSGIAFKKLVFKK